MYLTKDPVKEQEHQHRLEKKKDCDLVASNNSKNVALGHLLVRSSSIFSLGISEKLRKDLVYLAEAA